MTRPLAVTLAPGSFAAAASALSGAAWASAGAGAAICKAPATAQTKANLRLLVFMWAG